MACCLKHVSFIKIWNNKFWYTVASCRIFLYELYYDAWIHKHQVKPLYSVDFAIPKLDTTLSKMFLISKLLILCVLFLGCIFPLSLCSSATRLYINIGGKFHVFIYEIFMYLFCITLCNCTTFIFCRNSGLRYLILQTFILLNSHNQVITSHCQCHYQRVIPLLEIVVFW